MIFPPVVLWIQHPEKSYPLAELLRKLKAARGQNGNEATIEALKQFLDDKLVTETRRMYHFTPEHAKIIASLQHPKFSSSSSKQKAIDDLLKLESRVRDLKELRKSEWSDTADAFFAITVWRVSVLFEAFNLPWEDVHIHRDRILEQLNRDQELLGDLGETLKNLHGDTWPIDLLRVSIDLFELLAEHFPSPTINARQRQLLDELCSSASALFGIQPDAIIRYFNRNTFDDEIEAIKHVLQEFIYFEVDIWSIEKLPRALWELLPHLLSIRALVGNESLQ
jgi:hypothetical protein